MSITVRVIQDRDPMSPRDFDNMGTMACWHRRYDLGDVQPKISPDEWLKANAPKGSIILTLYLYDHSGITMNTTGFPWWDTEAVGVIVATPDKIRSYMDKKRITEKVREAATKILASEVATYNSYLAGNVWGFSIEGIDDEDGSTVGDSCFGFYGDDLYGMLGHVDSKYHAALREAWYARGR
jgi:hypothetical protein